MIMSGRTRDRVPFLTSIIGASPIFRYIATFQDEMHLITDIITIARWEIRRSASTMGKRVILPAVVLMILLVLVLGFTGMSGMHLQDGIYQVGADNRQIAGLIAQDARFSVYLLDTEQLIEDRDQYDIIVVSGRVYPRENERGLAAAETLRRDYERYQATIFNQQDDLFAAYPLWIDTQYEKSELDFLATQSGTNIFSPGRSRAPPVPSGPVDPVTPPSSQIGISADELRQDLRESIQGDPQISRYSSILSPERSTSQFRTPSQLTPPLPFDTIILIFVFIFPLYFTSQFYMMSIMQERIGRVGEPLLSTPVRPSAIIIGKGLPYLLLMCMVSLVLIIWIGASPLVLLPLIPITLFFLANALILGMVSRSFKELSFLSIFFSTVATSYLFFPSIFANVHIISLISPLTLIVYTIEQTPYTPFDYIFSTSLFFLTSAVLFIVAVVNYREERLFGQERLIPKIRNMVDGIIPETHPYIALFLIGGFCIPFVFMAQLLVLVLAFNLPMPLSLGIMLIAAAFIEEGAKSIGISVFILRTSNTISWRAVLIASGAVAAGFLIGEKLLLFITISQITESVFGTVLFLSIGALWMPFLLHFACVLVLGGSVKIWGGKGYIPGLLAATAIHTLYNVSLLSGWFS
jgi:ABC-type Na+ efflux pump permease subunit